MKSQIPTIFAIFILIATLIAILVVKNQIQTLTSSASSTFAPRNLRITNIKDTSFAVSWITDTPTISFVEYTTAQGQTTGTETSNLSQTHFVQIQNLNPNSSYSFRINSGGQFFDNNGEKWLTQTQNSQGSELGKIASGQVVTSNNLPAKNALVYIDIPGNITFASQVTTSGNWLIALPRLADSTILQITVETANQTSKALVELSAANPVPTITLGASYDFTKDNTIENSSDIPSVQITLP